MGTTDLVWLGQIWKHKKNGRRYVVIEVIQMGNPADDDNNPPMVRYVDGAGNIWCRAMASWRKSFEFVEVL